MIYEHCEQGTPEWHALRAGVITASKFRDALSTLKRSGEPTEASVLYCNQVAIERISRMPINEGYESWQMRRGTEQEPFGREDYEIRSGHFVTQAGIALTEDRVFGYSSDGLVGEDGLIEIKSLVSATKLVELWRTRDLSEWMHQIQGGLWITGRKWCDFICWAPQLRNCGKELFLQRVERDDRFIDQMELDLWAFHKRVSAIEAALRAGEAAAAATLPQTETEHA